MLNANPNPKGSGVMTEDSLVTNTPSTIEEPNNK